MRLIKKGKEPRKWTNLRLSQTASYDAPEYLKQALYNEQGGICAYCMQRLPANIIDGTPSHVKGKSVVEHLKPRSRNPEDTFTYKNLLLCCKGGRDANHELHCDASKGDTEISLSPLEARCINTIQYKFKQGKISSSDLNFDYEIDKTLNLNQALLIASRKKVYEELVNVMTRKNFALNQLKKWHQAWDERDANNQYRAFCGLACSCIDKWIRIKEKHN